MRQVTLDELSQVAKASRDDLWSAARSAGLEHPLIILHWSAGWYEQVHDDYHVNITGDGEIYLMVEDLSEVLGHTEYLNRGTVAVSLCCCADATSESIGTAPPTEKQIELMAQIIAILCADLWLAIGKDTVMTHGEAADNPKYYDKEDMYGPNNDCWRWDLQYLGTAESPYYTADHSNPITGGNSFGDTKINYLRCEVDEVKKILHVSLEMESLSTAHKIKLNTAVYMSNYKAGD